MDTLAAVATVDVVIPVRNGASLLPDCLDSVLAEVGDPQSVIIVDDGSTDDTVEIARRYGVRVLENKGMPGPYGARNFGVAHSRADAVVFFDMRSRARPGWLSNHRELLSRSGAALSANNVLVTSGPTLAQRVAAIQQPFRVEVYVEGGRLPYFPTCNLGVRRAAFIEAGGFRVVRSGSDASLCWSVQELGLGTFEYDRQVFVDWQPRDSLRGALEQALRFGMSHRDLARRVPAKVVSSHQAPSKFDRARRKVRYVGDVIRRTRPPLADLGVLLLLRVVFWIGVLIGFFRRPVAISAAGGT